MTRMEDSFSPHEEGTLKMRRVVSVLSCVILLGTRTVPYPTWYHVHLYSRATVVWYWYSCGRHHCIATWRNRCTSKVQYVCTVLLLSTTTTTRVGPGCCTGIHSYSLLQVRVLYYEVL